MFNVDERFNQVLAKVNKSYRKKWGYGLTANDLIRLWRGGELPVSDSEEDTLIEFTELHDL